MSPDEVAALAALCAVQQSVFTSTGAVVQTETDPAAKAFLLGVSSDAGAFAVASHELLAAALGGPSEADHAVARAAAGIDPVDLAGAGDRLGAVVDELLPSVVAGIVEARSVIVDPAAQELLARIDGALAARRAVAARLRTAP